MGGGWLVALVVRAVIRRGLGALGVNERLRSTTDAEMDIEGGTARIAYYVVLAVVLLAFFNTLDLQSVSGSFKALVDQVFAFLPKLIGAGALMLVAWVIAMGLRAMGLADDIVNLAFGLTLGAVAVALSFGLGGREAAGRQMEHWLGRLRGE